MTVWRIVAFAPVDPIDGSVWREAADAAQALASAHGQGFDLILVGAEAPTGEGWSALGRFVLAGTTALLETAAQVGAIGAQLLADTIPATIILVPPGPFGEELAADLAARPAGRALGRARTVALGDTLRATRSVFGARAEITLTYPPGLVTAAMRAEPSNGPGLPAPAIVEVEAPPPGLTIDRTAIDGRETPLEGARLVISGGRGLDEAGFALLGEIAASVGGAVGGSLPAVDAGLVPVSRQVGQSGKFVTPDLYVAVGLSGTPQHLAGIGPATRLVAINADPSAPIFSYAELGAVADASEILPLLRDALAEAS